MILGRLRGDGVPLWQVGAARGGGLLVVRGARAPRVRVVGGIEVGVGAGLGCACLAARDSGGLRGQQVLRMLHMAA